MNQNFSLHSFAEHSFVQDKTGNYGFIVKSNNNLCYDVERCDGNIVPWHVSDLKAYCDIHSFGAGVKVCVRDPRQKSIFIGIVRYYHGLDLAVELDCGSRIITDKKFAIHYDKWSLAIGKNTEHMA